MNIIKGNKKSLKKKKTLINITETLIGSGSAHGTSTKVLINPGSSTIIPSSTALLTSIAILITKESISE